MIEKIKNLKCINVLQDNENIICSFDNNISIEQLLENLKYIYDLENQLNINNLIVKLKNLQLEKKVEAIKFALSYENLKDPLMLLNIFNLIKTYNTLDDSFFSNQYIFILNIQELLDLKLEINEQLKQFTKQLSIYFISLFKSYNKISFTPLDVHMQLPNIYKYIILSADLLTLSSIFSISQYFNTKQCIYIDNAMHYINELTIKNNIGINFINKLFQDQKK